MPEFFERMGIDIAFMSERINNLICLLNARVRVVQIVEVAEAGAKSCHEEGERHRVKGVGLQGFSKELACEDGADVGGECKEDGPSCAHAGDHAMVRHFVCIFSSN